MQKTDQLLPTLDVSEWLNTPAPPDPRELCGRVVVIHAFQMLCPGCVAHGIPQAERIARVFAPPDVVVLGLHTVFEHHAAMNPDALRAFVYEYRLSIPIGIDRHAGGSPIPQTMQALRLRGTPSLVLADRTGLIRERYFGQVDDMVVGARIAALVAERQAVGELTQHAGQLGAAPDPGLLGTDCTAGACGIDERR